MTIATAPAAPAQSLGNQTFAQREESTTATATAASSPHVERAKVEISQLCQQARVEPAQHIKLVQWWANRMYRPNGSEWDDLVGEGCIGLLKAARRYDPAQGATFATYASWAIRARRQRAFRMHKKHTLCVQLSAVGQDDGTGDSFADRALIAPDEPEPGAKQDVRVLLRRLPKRWRRVIVLRYGLDGRGERTLDQIGLRLGVSRERVRQLIVAALKKLRRVASVPEQEKTTSPRPAAHHAQESRLSTTSPG